MWDSCLERQKTIRPFHSLFYASAAGSWFFELSENEDKMDFYEEASTGRMCVISVREVVIESLLIGSRMATYLLILRLEMNSLLMIHIFQQKRRVEIVKNDDHIEFHVTLDVAALWDSISTIFWTRKHSFFLSIGREVE